MGETTNSNDTKSNEPMKLTIEVRNKCVSTSGVGTVCNGACLR